MSAEGRGDAPSIAPRCVALLDLHAACHAQSCASPPVREVESAITRSSEWTYRFEPSFFFLGDPLAGGDVPDCRASRQRIRRQQRDIHLAPLRGRARRTSSRTCDTGDRDLAIGQREARLTWARRASRRTYTWPIWPCGTCGPRYCSRRERERVGTD